MGQSAHAVLDDHHRPVDDDAEIQRPQAHQVGAHLVMHHAGEGEQHRQGNHRRRDDGGTDVAQEQKQDHDHQDRAFQQVLLHRGDGLVHQHGAVVHRHRMHALGQAAVDLHHLLVHGLRHRAAVLADEHEHRAQHHFAAVVRGGAGAQFAPHPNVGHVAHPDRHTARAAEDDIANVLQRLDLPGRPDQILLAALFDVARAHVAVVAVQRRHDVLQGDAQRSQTRGDRRNLVFLGIAADRVDFRHTRNVAQLRLDDPVLNLAQIGGRVGRAVGLLRTVLGLDRPQVNLAQAGGDRPQRGRDAGRQLVACFLDALIDQLAREVDVGAVLEDDGHLRQAIARQGAGLLQVGQARHHGFNRVCHPLLGFQRRIARCLGIDLNLDVGDVRHGVDGQLLIAEYADGGHADGGQQHQPSVLDGRANEFFKHGRGSGINGCVRQRLCRVRTSRRNCPPPHTRPRLGALAAPRRACHRCDPTARAGPRSRHSP